MTTLADIRRVLSVRGIDPNHLAQAPRDGQGAAAFVFTPPTSVQIWFGPLERSGWRIGWHYIAIDPRGVLIDCGQTDTTLPEGLLPVLHRHAKPSPPRCRDHCPREDVTVPAPLTTERAAVGAHAPTAPPGAATADNIDSQKGQNRHEPAHRMGRRTGRDPVAAC